MRILTVIAFCMILTGCESMALKRVGLYLDNSTSVGMNDLGVAKLHNQF